MLKNIKSLYMKIDWTEMRHIFALSSRKKKQSCKKMKRLFYILKCNSMLLPAGELGSIMCICWIRFAVFKYTESSHIDLYILTLIKYYNITNVGCSLQIQPIVAIFFMTLNLEQYYSICSYKCRWTFELI